MGLYDLMVAEAKKQGVKLLLLQIPREVMEQQAVDKGDIQFFELAYLEVEIEHAREAHRHGHPQRLRHSQHRADPRRSAQQGQEVVRLHRLLGGGLGLPERHLHAGLGDLPHAQGPQAGAHLRPAHLRASPASYRVLVKVVDIFGNDTSQAFDVEVK